MKLLENKTFNTPKKISKHHVKFGHNWIGEAVESAWDCENAYYTFFK